MSKENEILDSTVTNSSGNVFADLNLPSSEEDLLKVEIARAITAVLKKRDLTQTEAASIIGMDQSKVSALLRGRLKGFSVDRLIRCLVKLGRDVDINISQRTRPASSGRIRVRCIA